MSLSAVVLVAALGSGCAAPSGGGEAALGSSEQALDGAVFAWAWVLANGTTGSPYANQSSGSASSSKLATGQYEVLFNGLHQQGSPQVVAYGTNAQCKLFTIPQVNGTRVANYVNCYDPQGASVDSAFVITFNGQPSSGTWYRGGYFSTGGGAGPTLIGGSWNSSGGANSVTWDATNKVFYATFSGLTFANASVHVTAYGANDNRCKVVSWGAGSVTVKCFDHAGNATASGFSISYDEFSAFGGHIGGHAWMNVGSPSPGYTNSAPVFECDTPGALTAAASGWDLDLTLTKSDWSTDTGPWIVPMVTAYGGGNTNYCNVVSWSASGSGATSRVRVRCFNGNGVQIDASSTQFDATISHRDYQGPC